jgi:hypothetical protein
MLEATPTATAVCRKLEGSGKSETIDGNRRKTLAVWSIPRRCANGGGGTAGRFTSW